MIPDETLTALSADERADLVRRIHAITVAEAQVGRGLLFARTWFPRFLIIGCVVLIPWTIGLALTLPKHYVTSHWRAEWIGFDVALMVGLAVTAWSLWRRRQSAIPAALITGTLLFSDAWFDVLSSSSRSDLMISLASAVFAEIPLGIFLVSICLRLLRASARITYAVPTDLPMPSLWRLPLVPSTSALELTFGKREVTLQPGR